MSYQDVLYNVSSYYWKKIDFGVDTFFQYKDLEDFWAFFYVGSYQIHSKQLIFIYAWNKEKLVPSS